MRAHRRHHDGTAPSAGNLRMGAYPVAASRSFLWLAGQKAPPIGRRSSNDNPLPWQAHLRRLLLAAVLGWALYALAQGAGLF
jgi:hypothetical protein